jgi:glycosyltransferase involved in cell wall biosynthesis
MNLPPDEKSDQPAEGVGKVLVLSGSFPPMLCGVGDSAHELALALANRGVDISLLTDERAETVEPGQGPVSVRAEIRNWGLWGTKRIVKTIESIDPDIVHIHYPTKGYGAGLAVPFLPMVLHARRRRFKMVLTLHEFRQSHPFRRLASFLLADSCDAIVMPCLLELDALMSRHPSVREKILAAIPVGPVGPSPDGIPPSKRAELRNRARSEWGVSEDDVVLMHYGTPTKNKGFEIIFKALRLLKLDGMTPKLVVVGDFRPNEEDFHKVLADQVEGLGIGDQVKWLGRIPEADLPKAFSGADIGIFPFVDGFTFRRSSLIGMLAWDIPIITTEPQGPLEDILIQDKVRLVARNDPQALATNLLPLVANLKALELAKSAPNPLKEIFRWENITKEYIHIYRQLSDKT